MGIFSKLFNSNMKSFSFNCPMCERAYNIKFDITDADNCDFYGRSDYYKELNSAKCEFCKVEMTVVMAKDGSKVTAFDDKWEAIEQKYDDGVEKVQEELDELEDEIADEENTPAREKKKAQLEARMEKIEDAYNNKLEKYDERRANWQEKWEDKLERMGG